MKKTKKTTGKASMFFLLVYEHAALMITESCISGEHENVRQPRLCTTILIPVGVANRSGDQKHFRSRPELGYC